MNSLSDILNSLPIADTMWNDLLKSALLFLGIYFGIKIIKGILLLRIKALLKKTKTHWDDSIIDAIDTFFSGLNTFVIASYAAVNVLDLSPWFTNFIHGLFIVSITIYVVLAVQILMRHLIAMAMSHFNPESSDDTTMIGLIYNISRVILWAAGLLMIMQNLGYNVTALLGGLGIAGIAISFAVKDILSDLFAYFTIHFDQPFKVGDFISLGQDKGTVEHIGLKSTRLKTLLGDQLVISNAELTSTRLNNYKQMEQRRMTFNVGVTYDTPNTKLKKIPGIIEKIIKTEKLADFDRTHFTEFADSALVFETVYVMKDSNFKISKDTQQHINLEIKKAFEKEKIEFAFPTQTVHVIK